MDEKIKQHLLEACEASKRTYGHIKWDAVQEEMFISTSVTKSGEQWRSAYRGVMGISHSSRKKTPQKPEGEARTKTDVVQNFDPKTLRVPWDGRQNVRFALLGDTHLNSKYTQLTYLHRFYEECGRQGIRHVYHTGDIDDGEQMRPGHSYECYTQGADEHVREIVCNYPQMDGITTHFITGNHDASLIKRCGYNIGYAIAGKRADMEYLGPDCAIVKLTPNCTLELRHPWDGTAYAISYKIQKLVDAMSGGEKPNVFAVGHYHKQENILYRNVHCFQTATFCAQTPFMKGKGISCQMGGYIVEIEVDRQGYIQRILPQFVPFYAAIADDWKNWR